MIARALDETLVPWVLALRWVVILVLVSSLPATTELLELHVHVPVIVATLAVLVAVNLGHRRLARALPAALRRHALFLNVAIDLVAITVFLAASGGAANPFSSILLVYVALGAALLPARAAFALAGLAALSFGALFLTPAESACCQEPVAPAFSNHLYGMWVAFILGACLVAFFVSRVRHAIEARDRELAELSARAERADKFAAVGTLAAGTAHELGTPLATISVFAGELESSPATAEQGAAIRAQVERCRAVLERMRPGARGEVAAGDADLADSVEAAVEVWRAAHPEADVRVESRGSAVVAMTRSDVEAAVCVLLDNALAATEAAAAAGPIVVRSGSERGSVFLTVEDEGVGVDPANVGRIGEPFFTTKETGQGMGLGLFVVRNLLEQLGGRLEVERRSPRGTSVRLCFAAKELASG